MNVIHVKRAVLILLLNHFQDLCFGGPTPPLPPLVLNLTPGLPSNRGPPNFRNSGNGSVPSRTNATNAGKPTISSLVNNKTTSSINVVPQLQPLSSLQISPSATFSNISATTSSRNVTPTSSISFQSSFVQVQQNSHNNVTNIPIPSSVSTLASRPLSAAPVVLTTSPVAVPTSILNKVIAISPNTANTSVISSNPNVTTPSSSAKTSTAPFSTINPSPSKTTASYSNLAGNSVFASTFLMSSALPSGATGTQMNAGNAGPPPCVYNSDCCTDALNQLPRYIDFEETEPAGTTIAEMKNVANVNVKVSVHKPASLQTFLKNVFNVTSTSTGLNIIITQSIDIEILFEKSGNEPEANRIELKIECEDWNPHTVKVPPRYVNVTVIDVDDSLPYFDHPDKNSECVVPIYNANTSEDYMGELSLHPVPIQAYDGDVSIQNNISYSVMHAEPEDYYVYFDVDSDTGVVNKTKRMNATEHGKYVLFVKASEDSPQQRSRVAVLSIVVIAPSDPYSGTLTGVHPLAKLGVQIASVVVLMLFLCGIIVLVHHRYRLKHSKVSSGHVVGRGIPLPKLVVYRSQDSGLNRSPVTSPSQVGLHQDQGQLNVPSWYSETSGSSKSFSTSDRRLSVRSNTSNRSTTSLRSNQSQKKKMIIVKKPIDTALRPGWNAPPPKPKRAPYNPFTNKTDR